LEEEVSDPLSQRERAGVREKARSPKAVFLWNPILREPQDTALTVIPKE
jgi:hypothetical protein